MTQRKIALSIEEAADYTGIGRNTLRQLVEWKKLPVLKVGRKVLIKTDILEMFMEANEGRDLRDAKMEILETKRGKSGVQSIVVRCGEYTAELTFCENCETDVMIPIKELIMSAYDLRKQREEQDNW